MTWNHRVIKKGKDYEYLAIHEVHYRYDGTISGYPEHPARVLGESIEELRIVLEQMLGALDKPVIDKTDEDKTSKV